MVANIKKLHIKEFPIAIQPITDFETQKKLSFQNNKYGITTNLLALSLNPTIKTIKIEIK